MFNCNFQPQLSTVVKMNRNRARDTDTHCTSM